VVGERIRRLRRDKGLSRQDLARKLKVDVTAIAAWEAGKYLPRDRRRLTLALALSTDLQSLFLDHADPPSSQGAANLVDAVDDLPAVLNALLAQTRKEIKSVRVAAPFATAAQVQKTFRSRISQRILEGTVRVFSLEIFYDLQRLQEVLSNIYRYDGFDYHVRACCSGLREVAPVLDSCLFDDTEFLLGPWSPDSLAPGNRLLRLSGEPFCQFFRAYWNENWLRGTRLNAQGAHHLGAMRDLALKLGLAAGDWPQFARDARELEIGDGAPPSI
jgi:transcriptional regulator with XRE-family HTH domain